MPGLKVQACAIDRSPQGVRGAAGGSWRDRGMCEGWDHLIFSLMEQATTGTRQEGHEREHISLHSPRTWVGLSRGSKLS